MSALACSHHSAAAESTLPPRSRTGASPVLPPLNTQKIADRGEARGGYRPTVMGPYGGLGTHRYPFR